MSSEPLSPRGALFAGAVFIAMGLLSVWAALRGGAAEGVPAWVAVCAGLFFVTGGAAVMLSYGLGDQVGPDGELSPSTPVAIRAMYLTVILMFVGLLGAIFAWIAFGPGERQFSMTVATPFSRTPSAGNETFGRWIFGGFAVLIALVFITGAIKGLRSLRE